MGVEPENRKLSKYCITSFSQERSLFGVSLVYKRLPTPSYIHDNKKEPKKWHKFLCAKNWANFWLNSIVSSCVASLLVSILWLVHIKARTGHGFTSHSITFPKKLRKKYYNHSHNIHPECFSKGKEKVGIWLMRILRHLQQQPKGPPPPKTQYREKWAKDHKILINFLATAYGWSRSSKTVLIYVLFCP